jgi:hypothetical protein
LSLRLRKHFNNTVGYGPFKGLKLSEDFTWSQSDGAAMILGLYEQEILELVKQLSHHSDIFINLGASDGYYAVGSVASNLFSYCYCYEQNPDAREVITKTAALNGVSQKLNINAKADLFFYKKIPVEHLNSSTILIDVEGAEIEILGQTTFEDLSGANIVVELHPWVEGFKRQITEIILRSRATHSLREIRGSKRDLGPITEIHTLPDNYKWILCSEGRPCQMSWLHFEPLRKNIF